MNHFKVKDRGQSLLFALIFIGVWLPIACFAADQINPFFIRDAGGGFLRAFIALILFQMEISAALLLVVYALWVRPWIGGGKGYGLFYLNAWCCLFCIVWLVFSVVVIFWY